MIKGLMIGSLVSPALMAQESSPSPTTVSPPITLGLSADENAAFDTSTFTETSNRDVTSGFVSEAPQALLYDLSTHTLLYAKNADVTMVPSSMTKILFTYMLFEALRKKNVALDTRFPVSERAWRFGGSKMFVGLGDSISFDDLLKGVVVHSGNDACIVLAEGLAGSEGEFANRMNTKAKELGAGRSHFVNTTGWPEENHFSTCKDLLIFAIRTLQDFPDFYAAYYGQKEFTYNGIRQYNRNPLLRKDLGNGIVVDGLKTGHTDKGGYGVVCSGTQGQRRLVFVINGLAHEKQRALAAEKILRYGFDGFKMIQVHPESTVLGKIPVPSMPYVQVEVMTLAALSITVPRKLDPKTLTHTLDLDPDLTLPVVKGQKVGTLTLCAPGMTAKRFPLYAAQAVSKPTFFQGVWLAFCGWMDRLMG